MTESPKARRISSGQVVLFGVMCLLIPIFVYFLRAAHTANEVNEQFLRQLEPMDAAISKMSVFQEFETPEGKTLLAQRTDLWARHDTAAIHANSVIRELLFIEYSYLAALFTFLYIAHRNKRRALSA